MLATLVIALREGLEAALIVSIIAAFLRKNNHSLRAMWCGVALALLLSLAVGIVLSLTERALPQAQQEAMEVIIGLIAVVFVSGMILWMNKQAPNIKQQLEDEAQRALNRASPWPMALMAFLAVLKEGFETSVFLLATFSAAQSAAWATAGAVIGLLLAVMIGWGIYRGGTRINLSRFFRVTGLFLVLVAAGLIVSALRSAHEAGWLNIGQQKVMDLYWLIAPGSIQSALISGVLGIPADPRLAEFIGWLSYLVIFALVLYWPAKYRPSPAQAIKLKYASAWLAVIAAVGLLLTHNNSAISLPQQATYHQKSSDESTGSLSLQQNEQQQWQLVVDDHQSYTLDAAEWQKTSFAGYPVDIVTAKIALPNISLPSQLTLDQVVTLYHNRVPPGLSPQQHPGPYAADWQQLCRITLWVKEGKILNSETHFRQSLKLSGSGLTTPRTLGIDPAADNQICQWQTTQHWHQQAVDALHRQANAVDSERWLHRYLPWALGLLAICLFYRARKQQRFTLQTKD